MSCVVCNLPKEEHAAAWGIFEGPLAGGVNNCAIRDGDPPSKCQMCTGSCYPKHAYTEQVIDEFRGPYHFLSNFYVCDVMIFGWTFPSSEHAYQAMKAADPAAVWPHFLHGTPGQAKRLGRTVPLRHDWNSVRLDFMRAVVGDKFTRHADLRQALVGTGSAVLVEGNDWGDHFWGVCDLVGENWLGKILMETRERLR